MGHCGSGRRGIPRRTSLTRKLVVVAFDVASLEAGWVRGSLKRLEFQFCSPGATMSHPPPVRFLRANSQEFSDSGSETRARDLFHRNPD